MKKNGGICSWISPSMYYSISRCGTEHEIFSFKFFHESVSERLLSIPLRQFRNFTKFSDVEMFLKKRLINGLNDAGDKKRNFFEPGCFFSYFVEILLDLHSSPRIFVKIRNYSSGPEETESCKNLKLKISCQTPFNLISCNAVPI